jgi:hypothetical protein
MRRLKLILRVGGVAVAACGGLFLGSDLGASWSHPGQRSGFTDLARMGAFTHVGRALLAVGAVAFLLSLAIPGRIDDDI